MPDGGVFLEPPPGVPPPKQYYPGPPNMAAAAAAGGAYYAQLPFVWAQGQVPIPPPPMQPPPNMANMANMNMTRMHNMRGIFRTPRGVPRYNQRGRGGNHMHMHHGMYAQGVSMYNSLFFYTI